ncbi:MAG: 4Fe-4S dicluster domain-containing protein [Desulfuromonadaceae bacterium]|nr:4Fe-4S dicluster domain-containing protein [Desulfuromonadaceae bacterium]
MTKELVVISGKGGTGKTSVTASLAVLAGCSVIADCDVDAADLHLVLSPKIQQRHEFRSGHEAVIREKDCIGCGACLTHCRYDAVSASGGFGNHSATGLKSVCGDCDFCVRSCPVKENEIIRMMEAGSAGSQKRTFRIDPIACEGCGVCVHFCPVQAIDFKERICGEWMISATRCGPMVHAQLGVAAENSGKLVYTVRREAQRIAKEGNYSLILVDGPPGIGCPVIASLTGADLVLVVTEPTLSGEHDLERVLSLTRHFGIPASVCVNKWDLNPQMTTRIEDKARGSGAMIGGRIRYDRAVTLAQMEEKAVVEISSAASGDVGALWESLLAALIDGNDKNQPPRLSQTAGDNLKTKEKTT